MKFSFRRYPDRLSFVREAIGNTAVHFLDVGNLGDGASPNAVIKACVEERGGVYTGLDSNAPLTKKMNLQHQVVGDIHHAPFPNDTFDIVYLGEVIEHTWTPSVMISECRRILKPNGTLIFDTPNPFCITRMVLFFLRREDSMRDDRVLTYNEARDNMKEIAAHGEVLLQPQHKIFFTPAMVRQLLETHGFVLTSIGCDHKAQSLIGKILMRLFPHGGNHLCVRARKASLDEAFADIVAHRS
jgi:SAM-dependent methyltransferase